MAEQPAQVGTLQRYLMQAEREMAELQEQLEEVNKQNSISCDALDLAATRHDDELRAVGTERDSLRTQLTEAQTLLVAHASDNDALRAERDGLARDLRTLAADIRRIPSFDRSLAADIVLQRIDQQSPSDSPAKEEWKWCPDCEGTERHGDPKRCDNSWHNLPDSPAKLGGAVSREELVEALRACATNQHPSGRQVLAGEFAHRLASLLERGDKVDG